MQEVNEAEIMEMINDLDTCFIKKIQEFIVKTIGNCNCHPISVLPVLFKVREYCGSLHPKQFGIRPKCPAEAAHCYFIKNIICFLDDGDVF